MRTTGPALTILIALAVLLTSAREVRAQQGPPYTIAQIETLIAGDFSTAAILERVNRDCLAFRMDAPAEERLRGAGAGNDLITGLRAACYRGAEPPGAGPPAVQPGPASATQLAGPSPWGGYRLRLLLYGAAAGGGAFLFMQEKSETSESCRQVGAGVDCFVRTETTYPGQTLGVGLIGAAVAGAVLDAVLTSRRASARRVAATSGSPGAGLALRLEPPSLGADALGMKVEWLRLRF